MTAVVLRGDARSLPLPDGSVDLIVTSPPYFGLRSYTDGGEHYEGQIGSEETPQQFAWALINCTREWMRVLKPEGSLFVNLGDKYAGSSASRQTIVPWEPDIRKRSYGGVVAGTEVRPKSLLGLPWRYALGCIDQLGLILRAEIIWAKPNGLPESATDRVRRSHEQVFHFTRLPRYFAAVDEVREPQSHVERGRSDRGGAGKHSRMDLSLADQDHIPRTWTSNPLGKLPGSVWDIPSQPLSVPERLGVDHFAAFPTELPRRIILGWAPPADGVVLDPFGGTGTTALVADMLGRTGISVDRSADYCRLARWRTTDPGERARALGVPKPPPVIPGQLDLLTGEAS